MSVSGAPATRRPDPAPVTADGGAGVGVVRWVARVLAWTVILGCLLALAVAVLLPRIGGGTPYTVLTGSMRPHLPPGTLVVVRPADPGDIGVGTVVTYQLRSGEPQVVTHRVVAVRSNLEGEIEFQTQGDDNDVPDEAWVRPEQVRGALWYSVPYLGRVNTLVTGHQRQLLVYVVAGGLAVYAGAMFAGACRDRTRRRRTR